MKSNDLKAAEVEDEDSEEQRVRESTATDQPGNQTDDKVGKRPTCNHRRYDLSTCLIFDKRVVT